MRDTSLVKTIAGKGELKVLWFGHKDDKKGARKQHHQLEINLRLWRGIFPFLHLQKSILN